MGAAGVRSWSRKKREEMLLAFFLLAPAALIIAVVTVYPLLRSLWISLLKWNLMKPQEGHPFVGMQNYRDVLSDPVFWNSVKVTIVFVGAAVFLEVTLGLISALVLNREFRGKNLIRMLALLPWAIPSVVNGIMWKWILNPSYGALNGLLLDLGLIDKYVIWLGYPKTALFMVILADVWKETPFIMLLLLAALQTIPGDLYEAARVDGANVLQTITRITIPLIRPTLYVAVSLRTIWALKSFDLIYTLTAGGPSNGTSVLGYYTYLKSFVSLQLGRGSAAAYIMTGAVMLIVIFYQRAIYREVEY
ncbi:MAG: sugar ABC transporter permease [Anaerolineales bacterium]|nr:sugar ABC transporter permease [Anaerolineales bacterium]